MGRGSHYDHQRRGEAPADLTSGLATSLLTVSEPYPKAVVDLDHIPGQGGVYQDAWGSAPESSERSRGARRIRNAGTRARKLSRSETARFGGERLGPVRPEPQLPVEFPGREAGRVEVKDH